MQDNIRSGKRPNDPLKKRVWRDLLHDWKRYLMIFIMLVVIIGFVSGMYVANNSMLKSLDDGIEKYKREDGHFRLSEAADEKLLSDISNNGEANVKINSLFYKEDDERLAADKDYAGRVRVYNERKEFNMYDILEGRPPEGADEIIIDRMHGDNADIGTGDKIIIGGVSFKVVGLAAFADYTALYESNNDTMFDAMTFDIAMVTEEGFKRLDAAVNYNYAFRYNDSPEDKYEEKKSSDKFLGRLAELTSGAGVRIEDYVPAYANQSINFAHDDMGKDKAMGGVLLYILTAVLAFIFAVTISTTLEKESSVIGTLRASGYTKGELLRYYMSAPMIVVVFASIVGNILGYTAFKDMVVDMYRNSYSLPTYETLWTPVAFVKTTIVPFILMFVINFAVILRTLRLSPLRFLRHDLKKNKRRKAIRLPRAKFFSRFRMRVFLQNIPNYIMLFIGVNFVMLMLSMAVGMPATLSYYQDSMEDMMFAKDQIILTSSVDENGSPVSTGTENAERFAVTSLERRSSVYDEEVSVYGIKADCRYISLPSGYTDASDDQVCISKAYADKYNVKKGDTITLSERFEDKDYKWKVNGICDYSAGIAVFMTNERFNKAFGREEGYFNGYMSDEPIKDIEKKYIAKEITVEDMKKLSRQLDHSMGDYMTYFQYVCVITAAIILYLLTKIIIEKNERSISMVKILGYSDMEISSLYLLTTTAAVVISELAALYFGYAAMVFFWKAIMMKMGGWFAFIMRPWDFVKEFFLVFIAYIAITAVDVIRIRRIPKSLALKNVE